MPTDVKTRAILALTRRVNATGRDLDAARLLSKCNVKLRAVESRGSGGALGNPAADITIHADRETMVEAKRTGAAERIRRAVREALGDTPLHRVQWAETAGQRAISAPPRRAPSREAAAAPGRNGKSRLDRQTSQTAPRRAGTGASASAAAHAPPAAPRRAVG